MSFPEIRANQVICTGISLIILGLGVFTLSIILSESKENLGFIFQIGVAYWAALPIVLTGVLGVTGGYTGKLTVTGLFLGCSIISCFLGGILAALVGFALTARRTFGECEHVQCPYDTESILMIALISVLILQAAISLSGVIESSQLLCCNVSGDGPFSIASLGNSFHREFRARSEHMGQRERTGSKNFFSSNYQSPAATSSLIHKYSFTSGKNNSRTREIGTTV
ncbi:uncharacterized protein [Montipora foliosa]|uniref:uncharacterized protein isoform X1 n=1 Tax=Montipora foliosa TaxID=591990 RepID=UPI0035F1FEB0